MKKYLEAKNDYYHPAWPKEETQYFWNEPIYGFYRSTDPWVLRRHAELLANADVDTVFTDNTNGSFTWKNSYDVLYPTWEKAQNEGAVDSPKVSFLLPFYPFDSSYEQIVSIYQDIYRPGKYQSLWFYWEDKPMLMGCNDHFVSQSAPLKKEIMNFYTWRSAYLQAKEHSRTGQWGWITAYPQLLFTGTRDHVKNRTIEETTVDVSQNRNYMPEGGNAMNGDFITERSYTSTYEDRYFKEGAEASKWGYFFSEQFDYAIEKDPQVIFVTGWNELRTGRHEEWGGTQNAFPDVFTDEFSRDIEPSKGDLKDHYYYQLVNYVRKFKGVNPIPTPGVNATIDMTAGIEQWSAVEPYYAAYIGNTEDRDAPGYGGNLYYTETSGRNDIIGAKVARDEEYVWFFVECNENITPYTDALWMNLYIDCDQQNQGWNTFEFVVNKTAASANTLVLEKFTADNDYTATEKVADVEYKVDGKTMTVKIPKSAMGLSGDDYTVNFAWTDNVHYEGDYTKFSGDIMDFYISGDVAPGGRFKFSFISTAENSGNIPETEPPTEIPTEIPTEPTEDSTEASTDAVTEAPRNGCSSSFNGAVILMIAINALGIALLRKRDD